MKNLSAFAILVSAAISMGSTQASAQAHPASEAIPPEEMTEARTIINSTFPEDERDEIFRGMMDNVGGQFAAAAMTDPVFDEPGIRAIMDDFFAGLSDRLMPLVRKHMPLILEATATAYTNEFTLKELQDIRAFSQTDSGRRYFRRSTSLLSDPAVARANEAYFAELQELRGEVEMEMRQKILDYLAANPDVVDRLATPEAIKK